jgi:hypothetical protein
LTALEQAAVGSRVLEPGSHISQSVTSSWTSAYVRRVAVTDAAAIVASVGIAQLVRFGTDPATFWSDVMVYSYTAVSAVLILAWFSALTRLRSREPRVVGPGAEEFRCPESQIPRDGTDQRRYGKSPVARQVRMALRAQAQRSSSRR